MFSQPIAKEILDKWTEYLYMKLLLTSENDEDKVYSLLE
jgi:hypothetical protein